MKLFDFAVDLLRRRRHGGTSYVLNGESPVVVVDYQAEIYRQDGAAKDFDEMLTFARSGTAPYADSDGAEQTAADGVARVGAYYQSEGAWLDGGLLYQTIDGESIEITNLPAGTYDVRVIRRGQTFDFHDVVHAGGSYWPD